MVFVPRFQPLNKYPYSTEKMQTNMYSDQIVSADQKCFSTNKPQIFMVIFISNCGDSINDADLTCKYGICSRFQLLNKYPYSTEKMQTKMSRDQIVSAEKTCLTTNKPPMFMVIFITNGVLDIQIWCFFTT